MGHSVESSCVNCGASIQADIRTIRTLVLTVLDDRCTYSVTDVCDLILRKYGGIPHKNWKTLVKKVLITESERSESCIWSALHKNEQIFGFIKNIEEWLLLRHHYRDTIKSQPQIDATIKEGLLAGFDPQNPSVPPGMSTERARIIACGLASMNCYSVYYLYIDTLLEFPDKKKLDYTRDVWNLSRYNDTILEFIFFLLLELVHRDDIWTDAVLETVCSLPLRPHIEDEPLNNSSMSAFSIPPEMSKRMAVRYVVVLNFIKDAPRISRSFATYFTEGGSDTREKRISPARMLLSYNPTMSQLFQPIVDRLSK